MKHSFKYDQLCINLGICIDKVLFTVQATENM